MRRNLFLILIFSLLLCSCQSGYKQEAFFFPIDSLLSTQVKELSSSNAELTKEAVISGESSVATYVPADTVDWKKELEVFFHIASINKPVNKTLYSVAESKDTSGLTVRSFTTSKEGQVVRFLKIYYSEDPLLPERIEARVEEKNSMFEGSRDLRLEFSKRNNSIILSRYMISGGQEMFLSDSVEYSISGNITIGN